MDILTKIKLRLGVLYDDPLKDTELLARIAACQEDLTGAGVPDEKLESELALDTIERYLRNGQNDVIYVANVLKLRG